MATWRPARTIKREPTARQAEVLAVVSSLRADLQICPTVREVAERLGVSVNCARQHLIALRRRGLVTWERGLARTIRTTAPSSP